MSQSSSVPTQPATTLSSSQSIAPTSTSIPSTPNNATVVDLTSKIKSNGTGSVLTYTTTPLPNSPYNDTSGYEYSLLVTPDASTMIVSCSNGNLYPFSATGGGDNPSCSELWAVFDDVLVADGSQRVAHYYNNTMSVLGVSRLRVEDEEDLPASGVVVGFAPYSADGDIDDGSFFYLAVDPKENFFYLMACEYEDPKLGVKIFLARDPDEGAKTLESEDVQFSVTGGKVKSCEPMTLMQGKYEDDDNYLSFSKAEDSAPWEFEE